jgi:hypothetical protein
MVEITSGTVVPKSAHLTTNDSNGKPLKFKAANEKDKNNTTWTAEGTDGKVYTVQGQPQVANVTIAKKYEGSSLAKVNDPYYVRMEANRPREGNAETTEEREQAAFGKIAEREDVPKFGSTTTTATTDKKYTK